MAGKTINLSDLGAEQVAALVAELKAQEQAKVDEAKAKREQGKVLVADFVGRVVDGLDEQTFKSGARGYRIGGSKVQYGGKSYIVGILIRDEATVSAKDE